MINGIDNCLSVGSLITYLHNAHDYFLNFRLPHIRRKLTEAITGCPGDIAFAITKFFDDYVYEVHKHMSYEEKIVFPYVRNLQDGVKDSKYNISIFRKRHDQIEMKIVELKNILLKYYPGPDNYLLNSIGDIQTIITCTGLDDFVNNRFEINKVFRVANGTVDAGQNGGI